MTFAWCLIGVFAYLLIGGIVEAAVGDNDDDLTGLIFLWPMFVLLLILVAILECFKLFGHVVVNLFDRFMYEGNKNETQE